MSLRLKLLLLFACGELLLISFFGYTAYDTAKLTNLNGEVRLLSSVTPRIAWNYGNDLRQGNIWSTSLSPTNQLSENDVTYLFVTDDTGGLVLSPDESGIERVYRHSEKLTSENPGIDAGSFGFEEFTYVWSRSRVPQLGHYITLIRKAHVSHANAFFKEMGVSLIVAAVILLWVASWAAMYVSMLIEKLDEQKNILKHRSLHDVLTGLPNRALLNDRLQQIVSLQDRIPMQFAVCFIDLNRFKDVNDTLGHHVGDELLLEVSNRIKAALRKGDTIARLGGDEFALILSNVNAESSRPIAEKLLGVIENPIMAGGHKLVVSGSMGIAIYPDHGEDVQSLIKNADVAMYAAKRAGTQLEYYSCTHEVFTQDKLALIHDLREAIAHDELELHYQPKFDIDKQKIVGVEALLRWKHPVSGYIPPLEFIPLAEHSGLIHSLSKWVLHRAFADSITLNNHNEDISLSINMSALYLQDTKFESDIREALDKYNVDAKKIILELTESAMLINSSSINELLKRLTTMGFRISVDDFGTGYSTLTNLRRMPISELKIDRSFIDKIISDIEDASIVDAMIGLGESLDIDVVAEGVETQEVLDRLKAFGCHTIQGYFISKPTPLHEFIDWAKNQKQRSFKLASN